ncbi:DASH family cryptochrome [Membranihabitans marinus]
MRIHDNEALVEIMRTVDEIIPIYVFDERQFTGHRFESIPKIFQTRALFLIESVQNLRDNLEKLGSKLIVRVGIPEEVIFDLANEYKTTWTFCNRERTLEEVSVQDSLEEKLWSIGQEIHYSRGKMLHYTQDLPFPISHTPDKFANFRKETERIVPIRPPLDSPISIKPLELEIEEGNIPLMSDLGWSDDFKNNQFHGGENEGLKILKQKLKEIEDKSSKQLQISPWLANGSLSPKFVYQEVQTLGKSSKKVVKELNKNLYLRDYHRLISKKNHKQLFDEHGFGNQEINDQKWDIEILKQWINGQTENDYVNACMKELYTYGYISHQQRRIVAYYLIQELKIHWLLGAAYFESVLLDYDPCSNYSNWQRITGISVDQKGEQPVNFESLDQLLDPESEFRSKWATCAIDFAYI